MPKRPTIKMLGERHNWKCYYCKNELDPEATHPQKRPTRDHKIPRGRGGNGHLSNIVLACYLCNHVKGDMTDDEFIRFLNFKKNGMTKKEALMKVRAGLQPINEGSWEKVKR